ncbi:MAG: hypothetical protein LBQ78_00210 [Tannerellaceae bacterium]|jgi:hypothetical protein|nr:hypothetical protein [Tannerellaceae bacterium]
MMKTMTFLRVNLFAAALLTCSPIFAQEESTFEISASADLVSRYVWRGVHTASASIQPGLTASWKGLSLTAWGSTDFTSDGKEVDLTLGYEAGGFNIAVTDYWWTTDGESTRYGNYSANHYFEGTVGYNFGESFPLTLTWNTMFGMDGDKDEEGKQRYSTYVEAAYDFAVKGVDLTAGIGVSPWTGLYHRAGTTGFALSTVSLKATKGLKITDSFTLPVFVQGILAPNQDTVFLVFGISL